jgi:MFS family permease
VSRDLRLLAGAVFLSAAGDVLALIVLVLHVHELTGSGAAVSALMAATLVPVIAAAPLAGLVADRCESVRVLVVASLAQAGVAVALALALGGLVAICALAALLSAGNAFGQPAEFRLVPAVAGARGVAAATGVLESARYAGFAVGPLLAAGLATLGPRPALLVNAASFAAIAVAAGALRVRQPPLARTAGDPPPEHALAGLRLLRADRVLRVALAAAVGGLLFMSASLTVRVFFVEDVVGAGDAGYALALCAWMAGVACGAGVLARRVPARVLAGAALAALALQGAATTAMTAWAVLPAVLALHLLGGTGHGVKNVLLRTLIAARMPAAVHGRAFAAYNAARNAAELAAVGAGGLLVGLLGASAALALAGGGTLLAALAGLVGLRASRRPAAAARVGGLTPAARS